MIKLIAIDFETHLIEAGAIFPKPVCLSHYDGERAILLKGAEMLPFLEGALSNTTIIAHNATFECGVIYHHFPELVPLLFKALDEGRIVCTMINEQVNNVTQEVPMHKFSLADLVMKYFDLDISATKVGDSWRLRYSELEGVAQWPIEAIQYALDDSIHAYNVFKHQPLVNGLPSLQASVYLNLMGSIGMRVDQERVALLHKEILEYLNPRYEFLIERGFCSRNKEGKVNKQIKVLKEYIGALGIELRSTRKGTISVDGESLEFYLHQIKDEIIQAFADLAVYEKAVSSYINRMQADTVYTQYSTVKSTGRTSAHGSTLYPSLNIQQMPREVPNVSYDIRNCFVPRPGKKIVSIDYAGLELASTAHQLYTVYKRSSMRDIINSDSGPVDLHSKLAAKIKGIPYEEFLAKKTEYKDIRQLAKPINLGFPGGIGYDTMRHLLWRSGIKTKFNILHKEKSKQALQYYFFKLGAPDVRIARTGRKEWALVQDELVKLKRDFFDLYPELEKFLKDTHKRFITSKVKYVKNEYDEWEEEPMYAYDIYGFKRDWCTYTVFCNGFLMQTPSAVGAKRAFNRVFITFDKHPDINLLAFVHDEILFEVSEDRKDLVEEAAYIMIEEMQSVLSSVRITVEASMSDVWQKAEGFWTKTYFKDARE